MRLEEIFDDIIKAGGRAHKYIKRTGSPGNYKYWYKLPDGRVVSSDDPSAGEHGISADKAKKEHLLRLVLGKVKGHHAMTAKKMAEHVGVAENVARNAVANHSRRAGRREDHGYEDHHIKEAHEAEWQGHEGGSAPAAPAESPRESLRRRARAAREAAPAPGESRQVGSGTITPDGREVPHTRFEGFLRGTDGNGDVTHKKHVTGGLVVIKEEADGMFSVSGSSQHWDEPKELEGKFDKNVAKLKANSLAREIERVHENRRTEEAHGSRDADGVPATPAPRTRRPRRARAESAPTPTERAAASTAGDQPTASAAPAAAPAGDNQAQIAELRRRLKEQHGLDLGGATAPAVVAQSQQAAREARARANAVASTTSAAARELHEADPALAAADEPVRRMEEAARRGENPYFARAKEIYNNIQGDLKPERRQTVGHLLNAISQLQEAGSPLNEANLLAKYKELSGSTRVRTLPKDEFEKGTYMTLEEVMGNAPLDLEVERMKRGYAAKQFTRIRPFLKDEWTRRNPSAPPPMPTFGDIKTWDQHGGPKPEWAGTTRTALPREVFDAAAKGADGKPKYPPPWMPIHMMPVWNYIVKKSGDSNPYQTQNPVRADQSSATGFALDTGTQAGYQEGIAMNAIRKYVKMRGGPEQLTDIPKNKLAEAGLTHSDIFKADADSDEGLKKTMLHKIIDPVALLPFVKEEIHSSGMEMKKSLKKSFSLVVDEELPPVRFMTRYTIEMKKSELIKKIRALKKSNARA